VSIRIENVKLIESAPAEMKKIRNFTPGIEIFPFEISPAYKQFHFHIKITTYFMDC